MRPHPVRRYGFGGADEAAHPDVIRAILAEFVSTFIFVFAGEGSILALNKMYPDTGGSSTSTSTSSAATLIVIALAHGLSLFAAVAASINVSGGHVNPAVTLGALVGGRISVIRSIYYWIAQLLGAVVASLLLRLVTAGMRPVNFFIAPGEGEVRALVFEAILTFGLVYVVYATAIDPKRGSISIISPLAIGLIFGANMLVGSPFESAAMNPARAFGPALVGWRWRHHWIYWVGPFIGGAVAGLVYEYLVIPTTTDQGMVPHHQPLAPEDY